jgi:hypothetical protein
MLPIRMLRPVLLTIIAAVLLPLPGFEVEAQVPTEPPQLSIAPEPVQEKADEYGAIAFTPDGSFFSVWKIGSRLEAEEKVRAECAELGRGNCEAVSFRGEVCAAIVSGQISKQRKITYSGGGLSPDDAERLALGRCNADRRARGTCQLRTTVCGDGRLDSATARAP